MTLLNIFNSGGLWLIPFATLIMTIVQFYRAYKASTSGSTQQTRTGTVSSNQNVPIYKTGVFKWAMCWLVVTIIIFIWLAVDYKGV